jgi:uncharacterized tellurite resistance protein B-like protein
MLAFLLILVLSTVGILLAYRFSPASAVGKRLRDALSPFEELEEELRSLRESLRNEIEQSSNYYIEGVHAARLNGVLLDELKRYGTGMRLQALKDIGVRTVADLQGWGEYRISQVRGVGPKSASAIGQAVATIVAAAKAAPINYPAVPFSGETERQFMQALYRQHWFDTHISEQGSAFSAIVLSHQCTRDAILAKTTLGSWLWKLGANETIRRSVDGGNTIVEALQAQSLRSMKETLSISLIHNRAVCSNRVPVESIIQDVNCNREFYDSHLTRLLGKSSGVTSARPALPQVGPNPSASSEVVHVEFGRVVPGPPPEPVRTGWTNSTSAGKQMQASENLVSVSIGSNFGHKPTDFTVPAAPHSAEPGHLRWLAKGEPIQIQGRRLAQGFVYVGKAIGTEQHFALNPWLSAGSADAASSGATEYYSSYGTLSSEQRGRYLGWLAEGALSSTEPGFGMLYFYGIERRVLDLIRGRVSNPLPGELEQLMQEVRRLGDLFKEKPGSVTYCCLRLSEFVIGSTIDKTSVPELPKSWAKTYELPFIIRFGIGCFVRDGKPIPVEWALRWAYVEPTIYLRTPATRCPEEFETAFAFVYKEKFGGGLLIPANKTKLKLTYQAGWPMHMEPEIKYDFPGIPDIAALTVPVQSLKALVEESTAMIDGYSRYLGRNTTRTGTLEAVLNLDPRFWPSSMRERWQAFRTSFVDPIQPVTMGALLRELGYVGDPAVAKIVEIAANLSRALVGFEPDIVFGARRPKPSEIIVLFPLSTESSSDRAAAEYRKASLIVSLSACVALADGLASEAESTAVKEMIASWQHLHFDLRNRLRAQYRLQVGQGITFASLKSRFASLTSDGRMQMAQSLSSLATVDGSIAAAEVRLLEQVYRALELEPQLLYSHLNCTTPETRESVPQLLSDFSATPAYGVDAARLAALRRETDQVTALLAEVFVEEEPLNVTLSQTTNPPPATELCPELKMLPGLDVKHQRFLAELLRKPSWSRSELESTAARMRIMLDGALERINEAAFDLAGEPVTEGDDPVYVQQNILENAR